MIEAPQFVQTTAQATAVIHTTIPRGEMVGALAPLRREVMAAIAEQGVAPAGPWFAHHLRIDPEVFDLEVGVPVASPIAPAGRVEPSAREAARQARTVYRGGYEGIGSAWEEFDEWIVAQGYVPAVDLWIIYVDGPPSNPDPSTWQTELRRGLIPFRL